MNWLWISGWAVPPTWLAAQAEATWPDACHLAVSPSEAARALNTEKFDVLGGYSLGAQWLMRQAQSIPTKIPVLLLAPILALAAEQNCGGRVALAQLRLQRRRLRSQPAASVADFFRRAGLPNFSTLPATVTWPCPQLDTLDEELGWLEEWRIPPPPEHWRGVVGGNDPLLDATVLQKLWPALQITPEAGHAPGPLLASARKFFS